MFLQRILTIIRQTSLYSIAWLSQSLASILLLPIYTSHLDPEAYGIVQMLDYMIMFSEMAVLMGLIVAVYRFFNNTEDPEERKRVISTSLCYVAVVGGAAILVMLALDVPLTRMVLGPGVDPSYTHLALYGFYAELLISVPMAYFSASGQPRIYVGYSITRLAVTIGCSVWFIVGLDLGAKGMLGGAMVGSSVVALVMVIHTLRITGLQFSWGLLRRMTAFGAPMVPATAGEWFMHNIDRFILRTLQGTEMVGIYALGYKFPFMVSSLLLSSFNIVWSSRMLYEIAKEPDAPDQYARVATYFMTVFVFMEYALAIGATTVFTLLVDPQYNAALTVVPVICLAMCFFAFHQFVVVGAMVHNRTGRMPVGPIMAAAVNASATWWAVPIWGYMGAAWVSIVTYGTYSMVTYFMYRNILPIPFHFRRLGQLLVVSVALFLIYSAVPHHAPLVEFFQQVAFVLLFPAVLLMTGFLSRDELQSLRGMVMSRLRPAVAPPQEGGENGEKPAP